MSLKIIVTFILSIPTWIVNSLNTSRVVYAPVGTETAVSVTDFFSLKATSLQGETISFDQYKGKKIIILNVASNCGYTNQYADWQSFYEKNKDKVVVLGFPCNQFMGQEPGDAKEIAGFCQKNYGVTFPMFEKINVKGEGQSEVYQWLTTKAMNGWNEEVPSWNFCKYLINEKGQLTHFFASKVKPDHEEFVKAIQ
jgi:glutathione peroxidase